MSSPNASYRFNLLKKALLQPDSSHSVANPEPFLRLPYALSLDYVPCNHKLLSSKIDETGTQSALPILKVDQWTYRKPISTESLLKPFGGGLEEHVSDVSG